MSRRSLPRVLLAFALLQAAACGAPESPGAAQPSPAPIAGHRAPLTSRLVYFGRLEVTAGALKSADGSLPQPGDAVTLRLFLPELGQFLCRDGCLALHPHLFVRFKAAEDFQEVPGIPQADYVSRGPSPSWPRDTADVVLYIPSDADRIETYMSWGRVGWNRATCTPAGDTTDCRDFFDLGSEYLSNFGRNFRIDVVP